MYKIIYEDEHLIAIDKLSNIPCIRLADSAGMSDELILEYPFLSKLPDFGFTHRIDNETLGVVVVAKDLSTYEAIRSYFDSKEIHKTYHARVTGVVQDDKGVIELPIAHSLKSTKKMIAIKDGYRIYRGQPRVAKTEWTVMNRCLDTSDLALSTSTGVRHQIRVHLLSIEHPICGDRLYSKNFLDYPSLMLISKSVEFFHPVKQKNILVESNLDLGTMFKEFF